MLPSIKLIDDKPTDWLTHRFYILGQYDLCLSVSTQILKNNSENSEALAMKGSVLRTKGRIDEALSCFQQANIIDPNNTRHIIEIAKCLYLLGRFQQSLSKLNQLKKQNEGNIWEVYHLIGQNYCRLKTYDKATDAFEEALDADFRIETVIELINVFETLKDSKSLKSLFSESLKRYPNSSILNRRIGKIYMSQKHFHKAAEYFKIAYERDPNDFDSLLLSGSINQELSNSSKAISMYRKAYQGLKNSPMLWNNVSLCISTNNKLEASISCCKKAIYCSQFEAIPLANMGLAFLELKMYCSAAVALKRALKFDSHIKDVSEGLGLSYMNLEDYHHAEKYLKKSIGDDSLKSHRSIVNLAICYYRSNKLSEAQKMYSKFKEIIQDEPSIGTLYPVEDLDELFSSIGGE